MPERKAGPTRNHGCTFPDAHIAQLTLDNKGEAGTQHKHDTRRDVYHSEPVDLTIEKADPHGQAAALHKPAISCNSHILSEKP